MRLSPEIDIIVGADGDHPSSARRRNQPQPDRGSRWCYPSVQKKKKLAYNNAASKLSHTKCGPAVVAGLRPQNPRTGANMPTIRVPGFKVAVPLPAHTLPMDLVPPEGPAGTPTIELVLEGSILTASAQINGKNYRKLIKTIAENGPDNVAVVLQGTLRPPAVKGGPYLLEGAGFQANLKTPKPAEGDPASLDAPKGVSE